MNPLKKAFLEFHAENPWVYTRMLEHCRALQDRGYAKYSARTLISVMRFEWDLKTTGEDVRFKGDVDTSRVKLNNNHSPYYARMIMTKHPEFARFFDLREVDSGDDGIYPDPPSVAVVAPSTPKLPPLPDLKKLASCLTYMRVGWENSSVSERAAAKELAEWIIETCGRFGVPVPPKPMPKPKVEQPHQPTS